MHKPKIFLDSSVIWQMANKDEKTEDTFKLLEEIKQGEYEACVYKDVIDSISAGTEARSEDLIEFLEQIDYTILAADEKAEKYSQQLIDNGILPESKSGLCLEIGCAAVNLCDMLVSWDYKYVANIRTISGIRFINGLLKYKDMWVFPPSMVIKLQESTV